MRRLDEAAAWRSSESDDPLKSSMIKHVKSHPAPQDIKFIKRYIAVCTPDALKFKESKRRVVQRAFAPKDLAEKDRFTENKAARILEERRLRAAQKDMRKAAGNDTQERQGGGIFDRRNARPSPRSRHSKMDMSEQYSQRNRMPRIDLGTGSSRQQNHSTTMKQNYDDSSDEEHMQKRMAMIQSAYTRGEGAGTGNGLYDYATEELAEDAGNRSLSVIIGNPYGLQPPRKSNSQLSKRANYRSASKNSTTLRQSTDRKA